MSAAELPTAYMMVWVAGSAPPASKTSGPGSVDSATPAKARAPPRKAGLLQVVLQSAIRLRCLIAQSQADHEVHIRRANMIAWPIWNLVDEVARREATAR